MPAPYDPNVIHLDESQQPPQERQQLAAESAGNYARASAQPAPPKVPFVDAVDNGMARVLMPDGSEQVVRAMPHWREGMFLYDEGGGQQAAPQPMSAPAPGQNSNPLDLAMSIRQAQEFLKTPRGQQMRPVVEGLIRDMQAGIRRR